MLAQFAVIVFALCAVLSLVVDIGYARLTQAQMQNAADTAALDGLRKRDPVTGQPDRAAARDLVGRVFDDDLDPTNGDPDFQFGAGPIIDLTDGVTSLHAAQTLSVPDVHVYKPDLQLNNQNDQAGDMVRGTFVPTDPLHVEDSSYSRTDFTPSGRGSAFLVRLRRSNEAAEPDVASSGPSLPLTFGKGTTILGDDPVSTYSVRRDGLTVRATAIAATRPALRVGVPQTTTPPLPGAARFALLDACVQNAGGTPVTLTVSINPATGIITRSGAAGPPVTCPVGTVVGRFVAVANQTAISTVGQALPGANVAVPCLTVNSVPVSYAAVYSMIAAGTNRAANRVIGFARIAFTRNACPVLPIPTPGAPFPPPASFTATIVRAAPAVAASNATANLIAGLPLPATAQPADVTELLARNLALPPRVNYGPVLVAVLAR